MSRDGHDLEDGGLAYRGDLIVFDILTIGVIAGFALVIVLGAWLGAGSTSSLADLLASPTMPARPRGVQESDLPRFVFRDTSPADTGAAA